MNAGSGDKQVECIVIVTCNRRPGFDRCDHQSVVDHFDFHDMRGIGNRRLRRRLVTSLEVKRLVAGVPQQRRIGPQSVNRLNHTWQR